MGFFSFLVSYPQLARPMASLLVVSTFFSYPASGQATAASGATPASALAQATRAYHLATHADSHLLNGLEYVNLTPAYFTGNPFFASDLPQRGTIGYDGSFYARVPLRYEQVQDQVILFDSVRNVHLQLFSEKITAFSLGNRRFVRLVPGADGSLATGFYEVLAEGPASLLARRRKKALKYTEGRELKGAFEPEERFIMQHQGQYREITKLSQVLAALPAQKPALQKFARDNKLRFDNAHREGALLALLRYYNELAQ